MLWRCWLGVRKGIRPVKTEWWGAGVVICLERGADLHTAQLMPLPLTVSCSSKIQIGFTFLVPAHLGSPGQRAVKQMCVYAYYQSVLEHKFPSLMWSGDCGCVYGNISLPKSHNGWDWLEMMWTDAHTVQYLMVFWLNFCVVLLESRVAWWVNGQWSQCWTRDSWV